MNYQLIGVVNEFIMYINASHTQNETYATAGLAVTVHTNLYSTFKRSASDYHQHRNTFQPTLIVLSTVESIQLFLCEINALDDAVEDRRFALDITRRSSGC